MVSQAHYTEASRDCAVHEHLQRFLLGAQHVGIRRKHRIVPGPVRKLIWPIYGPYTYVYLAQFENGYGHYNYVYLAQFENAYGL